MKIVLLLPASEGSEKIEDGNNSFGTPVLNVEGGPFENKEEIIIRSERPAGEALSVLWGGGGVGASKFSNRKRTCCEYVRSRAEHCKSCTVGGGTEKATMERGQKNF